MMDIGQGYRENIAQPVTQAVRGGLDMLPFDKGPASSYALDKIAQTIVPQSMTALGIMGGAAASGGLGFLPAVLGAGAGGLIGGSFDDRPVGGFIEGVGAGLVGEGGRYGTGVIRRIAGQQGADEAAIGGMLERMTPGTLEGQPSPLRNAGTAPSMGTQVGDRAQSEMSAALSEGLHAINSELGGGSTFQSPAISKIFPDRPSPMTFLEAADAIRLMGTKGFSQTTGNVTGGVGGALARDYRKEAIEEVSAQLPDYLVDVWRRLTSNYGKQAIMLDLLQEPNVLYPAKAGEPFSGFGVPALQQKASQYRIEGDLAKRFSSPDIANIESAIQRGGTFSEGTDVQRSLFPMRMYIGPGSEGFRIPLPTKYVGNPLEGVGMPFTMGMGNLGEAIRNPYIRRPR
jgi:hypothetical protein